MADFPNEPMYQNELAWSLGMSGYRLGGHEADSEAACRRAIAIEEKLMVASPTVPDYRYVVGMCYSALGNLLLAAGRNLDAEAALRQAEDHLEKLWRDFPKTRRFSYRSSRVGILMQLARLRLITGRRQEAEEICRQVSEMLEALRVGCPVAFRHYMADHYLSLGSLFRDAGHAQEAEQAFRESRSFKEKFVSDLPTRAEDRDKPGSDK
jgi:tetratricopeptide (TPR) repeat protein